jgi:xylan 1,4-beta-xylosidase
MRAWSALIVVEILAAGLSPAVAEEFYANPVVASDLPDPSIIRVGATYWATATSSEWAPQFPQLKSDDLVNWECVGSVFAQKPAWSTANYWAPELMAWRGKFYVYYVARKKDGPLAVGVATADRPEGPYTDRGPIVAQDAGSIDPVAVDDEKGRRFLVWKEDGNSRKLPTILWAAPLNEDGTRLAGEPRELFRNDVPWEGAVIEGPFIVRRGDWFYLFYSGGACCGRGCTYGLGVARAKALLGPWEKCPRNPILAGNEAWKCPGHGSIVDDPQGRSWLLYHAYAADGFPFTGRQGMLDEVVWDGDGWPSIRGGKGASVRAPSPSGRPQKLAAREIADDFDAPALKPGWNWPVSDPPEIEIRGGALRLARTSGPFAALGRALPSAAATATVVLDRAGLGPGVSAGIAAVGDLQNAVGLAAGDGKLVVWKREKGQREVLAEAAAPAHPVLHLRLAVKEGRSYSFSFSADGSTWTALSGEVSGAHLPPWDRAVRLAMTVEGPSGAAAQFDRFRLTP